MRNTKHAGELAEILFLYQATAMGLIVTQPYGDNARYDFAVDNGARFVRVQVKSCGAPPRGNHYNLNVCRHSQSGAEAYLPTEIDILAAYIVPENRWYLFPVAFLDGRLNLKIHIRDHIRDRIQNRIQDREASRFGEYLEGWDLLRAPEPVPVPKPTQKASYARSFLACMGFLSRAVRNGWSTCTSR